MPIMQRTSVKCDVTIRKKRVSSGAIRFAPVRSHCTLDLSAGKFAQSDAFERRMNAAHVLAVRANYCYR